MRAYSDVSDQVFSGRQALRLSNKTPRYISRVERALWLVHLARHISLYGPLNSKVCFDRQNISSTKIRTDLRKITPTRKTSKTQKQISQTFEADSSSFWVGQAKKLSTKVLLTESSLSFPYRKTLAYLKRYFRVILHYSKLWVLNEYFELLTPHRPVLINGSQ